MGSCCSWVLYFNFNSREAGAGTFDAIVVKLVLSIGAFISKIYSVFATEPHVTCAVQEKEVNGGTEREDID